MTRTYEDDRGVQWMLAYQRGSEAAFDLLVEAYSGRVYALFTRFLGLLRQRLDRLGIRYAYLDGRTHHRQAPVERFLLVWT